MKNNKKAFTLIEVVGVIAVLSLMLIVAVPALTRTLKRNEQKQYDDYINSLKNAAETYTVKNIDEISDAINKNGSTNIVVDTLVKEGYVDKKSNFEKPIPLVINVTHNANKAFNYEVKSISDEYTMVEYIESVGSQYIKTNIIPDDTFGTELEVVVPSVVGDVIFLGSRSIDSGRFWNGQINGSFYLGWNTNMESSSRPTLTANTKYIIKTNYKNNRKLIYNDLEFNITEALAENTQPITLFAGNDKGTPSYFASIKLYNFKVTRGNKLIAYFVPCYKNSNNEIGLYDVVNDIFYTNQGTGNFKKGSNI